MMLNVNVFDLFIMLRVFNESDNALIIVENNDRLKWFKESNLLK